MILLWWVNIGIVIKYRHLKILVEADFLVNLYEDDAGNRAIDKAYKRIFKTETGKKIFRLMFGYEEED